MLPAESYVFYFGFVSIRFEYRSKKMLSEYKINVMFVCNSSRLWRSFFVLCIQRVNELKCKGLILRTFS